jgi:predicted nucleotidyltransferase
MTDPDKAERQERWLLRRVNRQRAKARVRLLRRAARYLAARYGPDRLKNCPL